MTAAQLQGTPTTLSNENQTLVPNEDANKAILAQFRN